MFAVISRSRPENISNGITPASSLQRARGVADLIFSRRGEQSFASRAYQQGAMKVCFPNVAACTPPEAVLLNTAGGLTGGDTLDISLAVEAGAAATVTSQACEKVYRSTGDCAHVTARITLDAAAELDWLPQPTIFFDGARLARETHVDMEAGASLLALEGVIFGRTAMGETVEEGSLSDSWSIRCQGRLIHADRFDAKDPIGTTLRRPLVLGGNHAMATLRYIAPRGSERLEEMRNLLADSKCAAAVSIVNGMMITRFAAIDGYALTNELVRVLQAFRPAMLPRVWLM